MLESLMIAERSEFLVENAGNKGNGYRPGSTYGHGSQGRYSHLRDEQHKIIVSPET